MVLNGAKTLERTLQSVLDPGFEDLDYVVIDGGSTDGTLDIIRKYESRLGYWRSEPDNGLYDAMNKGVRAARGRWVLFLGADDVLVASLGKIAPMLTDERTIYYGDVYMPRRKRLYDGPFSAYKLMFHNICQQAIFYPRRVFEWHCFDTRYRLWADHALNIACYGDKRLRFAYIGELICLFNDYTGATSYATDALFEADRESLIRAHLPRRLLVAYLLRSRILRLRRWLGLMLRGARTTPR